MAMMTMATTMENTKATIKTSVLAFVFLLYSVLLCVSAEVNLFCSYTAMTDQDRLIDRQVQAAAQLPDDQKLRSFSQLLRMQEKALSGKPSSPYGWARLSYLRVMTGQGDREAFAALRMSDLVSPYEPLQLPERAVTWLKFKNVETDEERQYQNTLWQKAYATVPDATWKTAQEYGITKYVGQALAHEDKDLGDGWRDRMVAAGMIN